jgi:hypothetical protein
VRVLQDRYGLRKRKDAAHNLPEVSTTEPEQVGFSW